MRCVYSCLSAIPAAVSYYMVALNEFGLATLAFSLRADSVHKAKALQAQVESAQVNSSTSQCCPDTAGLGHWSEGYSVLW